MIEIHAQEWVEERRELSSIYRHLASQNGVYAGPSSTKWDRGWIDRGEASRTEDSLGDPQILQITK